MSDTPRTDDFHDHLHCESGWIVRGLSETIQKAIHEALRGRG